MGNHSFQFKQFNVNQQLCAMKVGTDGVLLGAWTPHNNAQNVLDIGTGSGLVALMLAQRLPLATIDAIDLDPKAVTQASDNFMQSPWSNRLHASPQSLQEWAASTPPTSYNLIVSNPPFFSNSLKSNDRSRNLARHTDTLPLQDLLQCSAQLLATDGILSLVYPYCSYPELEDIAWIHALFPQTITTVYPNPAGSPKRILATFGKKRQTITRNQLYIRDENNEYSTEYQLICKDFYLNF